MKIRWWWREGGEIIEQNLKIKKEKKRKNCWDKTSLNMSPQSENERRKTSLRASPVSMDRIQN